MRLLWFGCVLFPVGALAADLPTFSATYDFNLDNKLSGKATRTLSRVGDQYHYEFSAKASFASALETSDFEFDGKQVRSLSYRNRKQVFFRSRENTVRFDWNSKQAHTVHNDAGRDYAIRDDVLDPLNLEIQLRHEMQEGGKLKGEFWLGDVKGQHSVSFEINGTERIKTPYGVLDTIKVRRAHDDPGRVTQFWLAPSLDYLPVRFLQQDDGAVYTLLLSAYNLTGVTKSLGHGVAVLPPVN